MPKNHKAEDSKFAPLNKHRKINPNNFTTTTTSSSQEEEVVIVDLDFHFRSKLLSNVYKIISKFKINSTIIIQNNIFLSNEIIYHTKHNSQSIPPQLLYRGSRDGFKAIDFHSRCDHQGPTLTIIKSAEPYNQIFGGFTTQSWKSSNEWISDDSAFIFKINDENVNQQQLFRKFNNKQDRQQFAICVHVDYLPIFGGGGQDIGICSDCNLNNNSHSNFGYAYELPSPPPDNINGESYQYGSEKAKSYLAGSEYFKVSEIEVFKISDGRLLL